MPVTRAPGHRCTGFAALLLAPLLFGGVVGCAKRLPLTENELARIQTEAGIQPLRVYTSKKLINVRYEANVSEQYQVQKRIQESSDRLADKEIITRDSSGLIIKVDELNGAPAAWVTFDPRYDKPEDATIFVQGDDGLFRLHSNPVRKSFDPSVSYRGFKAEGRKLAPGKMKSLAEPNDVLLVKKKNGKILTIELQVKKVTDDRTRTRTRRVEGID